MPVKPVAEKNGLTAMMISQILEVPCKLLSSDVDGIYVKNTRTMERKMGERTRIRGRKRPSLILSLMVLATAGHLEAYSVDELIGVSHCALCPVTSLLPPATIQSILSL